MLLRAVRQAIELVLLGFLRRSRNVVEDGEKVGKIEITAEKDTYLPGDIVNLSVKVTGKEELDIEEGRVALVCANRYLYQYETTDSDNTETYRTKEAMDEVVAGDERILEEKTILPGSTSGHELAFEVPHTAAPSASGEITNVEWKVRVTLVVRGAPDVIKELPLTILSTSDSSPPPGFQRPAA